MSAQPIAAPVCPHAALAGDFKPFDLADPFAFYARARDEAPVFYSEELDFWVVSRYEDIREIFRDPETFSSENTQAPYKQRPAEVQKVLDDGGFSVVSGLSAKQPPDHTRLRGFIKKAFTPRRIAELEPQVREITTSMIDRFAARGHADLVSELAYDLPAFVIFRLLGVPEEDVENVKEWAQSRVYMNFGDATVEEQVHHAHNLVRYWRFCQDLVQSRLDHPQDDLPGELARLYEQGEDEITKDEIAALVYGQLTAGHETTTALLSNAFKELLVDRTQWDALRADPELIPGAVEEILRVGTPVFAWKRKVKKPATVAGVQLPAGTNLLLLLGSANRDPETFPEPERIDPHRENASRHLAFGLGIHFCLGAPLARLEGKVVLEEVAARLPGLRLVEGQSFDYQANTTFRGPSHVLVEWDVADAPLVLRLEECPADAVEAVGGKGASLATLLGAGLPVPPGFVVTTAAFDATLAGDGLGARVAGEVAALDTGAVAGLEAGAATLRGLVEAAALPAEVDAAVRAAYRALGDDAGDAPVAVRSSATSEDSAEASFAGQQDTYLWVIGEDDVVAHVRRCWASLYSARSIAYRRDNAIAEDDVRMAVVVQRMVDAQASGVAMTLHPGNGDRSKIVIDASFGLGEAVVSGMVTPDNHVVDKVMLEVVDSTISDKAVEIVPDPAGAGVLERVVEDARRTTPALSAEQVRAVAELAKRAERHYGCPQDVEWAIDATGVVLLQSRPETVWSRLPADPAPAAAPSYTAGLGSLVDTLVNPLATRRAADVRH